MGKPRMAAVLELALKLKSFIDENKEPKGLNLAKLISNIIIYHDYESVGQLQMKSLFLGMMHFQDKYNQMKKGCKDAIFIT